MKQLDLVQYIEQDLELEKVSTSKKVAMLVEAEEDWEFYPTTNEIMQALKNDLLDFKNINRYYDRQEYSKLIDKNEKALELNDFDTVFKMKMNHTGYLKRSGYNDNYIEYDSRAYRNEKDVERVNIGKFLEIGAGDGRVLDFINTDEGQFDTNVNECYAIEKSDIQADELVKKGIAVIGRDFHETFLVDKQFSVSYCNPPYSEFKIWIKKVLTEINSGVFYFTIPERWKDDSELMSYIRSKFVYKIIGNYDFSKAERQARAKVDLVKFVKHKKEDTFDEWIKNNIGEFKEDKKIDLHDFSDEHKVTQALKLRQDNMVDVLVEAYQEDMQELIETYSNIGKIPFHILKQLDIKKEGVLNKIKDDIKSLKRKYWSKSFSLVSEITSRLTYNKREKILSDIKWINDLDFNQYNLRTIIVWVIDNYQKFTNEELLDIYERLTEPSSITAYKSNKHWVKDSWRYGKWNEGQGKPEMYSLDYRIVSYFGNFNSYDWEWKNGRNIVCDLNTIANKLGFEGYYETQHHLIYERGMKHIVTCNALKSKNKTLFEYKLYNNGNVHFKLNKEFLMKFNVEVGKLKGWIKKPQDIQDEFDVNENIANELFCNNPLALGNLSNQLLMLTN